MDAGEFHLRSSLGTLKICLVGKLERTSGFSSVGKGGRIVGKGGVEAERGAHGGVLKQRFADF